MQQFSFIDLFIDLLESALHVSGDKLSHFQEHFLEQRCEQPARCNNFRLLIFLLIYLNMLHMFRATNSPIFRSTFTCILNPGKMHRYCCRPVKRYRQKSISTFRWSMQSRLKQINKNINKRKLLHFVGCSHRCSKKCS